MPNHVTNHVRIQLHDGVDHEEFLKKIGYEAEDGTRLYIDFEKLVPPPTEDPDDIEYNGGTKYGTLPGWYQWRCEHWGTKWNAYNQDLIDISYGCIELKFDTAWAPPIPIIDKLREMEEVEWVGGNFVEEFCESAGVF